MRIGFLALAMMASVTGCTADAMDAAESSDQAVVGGNDTFEHPEIGLLHNGNSYCTATLIRPNVVLTSAHCVTNGPKDEAVTGYSWDLKVSATENHHFDIDRAYSIPVAADFADGTQAWRAKDIALMKLTTTVDAALAKPMTVATAEPRAGMAFALYGYGCLSRDADANGHRPGGGVKRKVEYTWTEGLVDGDDHTQNTCPGDSGGPWLDVAAGAIFGTTSGYVNANDVFSDVPASGALVNRIADGWAAPQP